ncbi:MAG: anti-sigma factor, partial [Comamonadaceae bacterium]
MKDFPTPPPDDADLHAWVDGRLDPGRRAAVQARLDEDPEAARTAAAWASQKEALRALHDQVHHEAVPPSLRDAALQLHQRRSVLARWQHWGGIAAALLVAFGIGWAGHAQWTLQDQTGSAALAQSRAFARQAVVAHAVYAPEVRHYGL